MLSIADLNDEEFYSLLGEHYDEVELEGRCTCNTDSASTVTRKRKATDDGGSKGS